MGGREMHQSRLVDGRFRDGSKSVGGWEVERCESGACWFRRESDLADGRIRCQRHLQLVGWGLAMDRRESDVSDGMMRRGSELLEWESQRSEWLLGGGRAAVAVDGGAAVRVTR
eukprot:459098-Rhodomonas_salina.2